MQALKYMVGFLVLAGGAGVSAGDLQELESIRMPYPRYEISDIFGAAKLIESLLKNSDRLKELLKDPMHILQATVLVGSIAAVVKISLHAVQSLSSYLPQVLMNMSKRLVAYCMRICNIPVGFDLQHLLVSENLFEHIMAVWCEPIELSDKNPQAESVHWDFRRYFVRDTLNYLIHFMESHQNYYRAIQLKRSSRKVHSQSGDTSVDLVCFLVQSVISSMKHLSMMCEQADRAEDFDAEHVRKVTQNTVILLKKLRASIHESAILSYNQSEYNNGGHLFMPASSIFDAY